MAPTKPKVALVHDWLTNFAGAEQVLASLMAIYPDAPIYTSLLKKDKLPRIFEKREIITSSLQKFSFIPHQLLYPYMGKGFEQFDLSEFDIVISSSHASSKGVITKPETLHICYCHTPTRYLWSHYFEYLEQMQFGILNPLIKNRMPRMAHKLRIWDRLAADRPDEWIANSKNVAKRIEKYYRKNSTVIYPPVNTDFFELEARKENYFLTAGRLIPYKKTDIIIKAFNDLGLKLKIIGTGPEEKKLRQLAKNNIEFLGKASDGDLKKYYSKAKGFIFPTEEDFGIVPVEAMASGTPVLAFAKGGALESVAPETGLFFKKQTVASLKKGVIELDKKSFSYQQIREHSLKFSKKRFEEEIKEFIENKYANFKNGIK